jgi:hypothetical protein
MPASGRWATSRSSSSRAPAVAIREGRGGRPSSRSIRSAALSGSEVAQASAAAAAFAPVAVLRRVTRTTGAPVAAHRPASRRIAFGHFGLAAADEVTTSLSATGRNGDGGRRRTVTSRPFTETSTSSSAQPGSASRAAAAAGRPKPAPGARLGGAVGESQRVAGRQQLQGQQSGQQQSRKGGEELDRGLAVLPSHPGPQRRARANRQLGRPGKSEVCRPGR